jgi:hypothetical protein
MGRRKDETGESPVLSRNCDPLRTESQADHLLRSFHLPRGKEVEARRKSAAECQHSTKPSLLPRQGVLFSLDIDDNHPWL